MGWNNDCYNSYSVDFANEGDAMKGLYILLLINTGIVIILLEKLGFWEWIYKFDFWL